MPPELDAVIVADGATDLFNPNAIRASLGTLFTCPVLCRTQPARTASGSRNLACRSVCAPGRAAQLRPMLTTAIPTALVLGSEAQGVSAGWSQPVLLGIKLPMYGVADSLNVSATAAVLFYEAQRQRRSANGES